MNQNILEVLIKEYGSGKIDKYVFQAHSQIKLQFLKSHTNYINESSLKSSIEKTINSCEAIFRQGIN